MTVIIGTIVGVIVFVVEILGILAAINVVMKGRTPQGTIAWAVALLAFPLIGLPLFLVFGRRKFHGMVNARRSGNKNLSELIELVSPQASDYQVNLGAQYPDANVLNELAHLPFLTGNDTELLVDGVATFEAIFESLAQAEHYVLAEFFIVNDDGLGRRFAEALIAAAKRGCKVYLLYDEVGSKRLSRSLLRLLRESGVVVSGMNPTRGWFNRFQVNFRNHRKTIVVDGKVALVGGLNVGDEYIHKSKRLTPWRDTHMRIVGPAVLALQIAFVEDWFWATDDVLTLSWIPEPAPEKDRILFVLPSGPDDDYETCGLFFTHVINSAQDRLWIASPYFVPDDGIVKALQLAAMRGVDVRIIIPGLADKWIVKQAALSYVEEVTRAGVKMYEYNEGFMHQKVVAVDDVVSIVGTANFDNRSFRLNFEVSVVALDEEFSSEVRKMLEADFENSSLIDTSDWVKRNFFLKLASRVARLFAPVL